MTTWKDVQAKCAQPGSVVLNRWNAERRAARAIQAAGEMSLPDIRKGTELFEWMSGGMSSAGVAVTEQSAMRVGAVYSCINLIGGALASLPLPVYKRTDEGRQRANHAVWWMLNEQPNPTMSAAVFWEYLAASLLLNGDAYARILRQGKKSPDIIGFEPLPKRRITTKRESGRLWYYYDNPDTGRPEVIDQDDMLHVPGPGFDGLTGMSQIRHALRNPAGIALAADEYSAAFFKNGARPDFAIEVAGTVTPEQQDMLRRTWSDRHGGLDNAHLPALMVGGAKVHELTMNAEDAQLIDTRRFQVEDIARIFGVPPHMIGHTTAATSWGTGIEQMSIGFVKYTLQRHLVKFEQEINRKVWPNSLKYFVEFSTSGLERGDYKTRNEGYRIALGRAGEPGWMTVNEVRRLENLPPIDGGDEIQATEPAVDPEASDAVRAARIHADAQVRAAQLNKEAAAATPAPVVNNVVQVPEQPAPVVNNVVQVPEQPAPVVNNVVQVPEQPAPVVNNVVQVPEQAPPDVHAHFEATLPETVVNVAAPTVNIVNDVQPAEIKDINIVSMPTRETSSSVKRDRDGNIISTTQVESDQ